MPRKWSEERWVQAEDGSYTRNRELPSNGYDEMTKPELQAELEKRGLPTTGNKPELIERLQEEPEEVTA